MNTVPLYPPKTVSLTSKMIELYCSFNTINFKYFLISCFYSNFKNVFTVGNEKNYYNFHPTYSLINQQINND